MTERTIDRYKILRSLGIGGMGEVLLAYDPSCEREVALKKIKDELKGNPAIKERFLREAKIASQLSHPSIIPIYTIHTNPEEPFYTMPYVEGETLKQILKVTREQEKAGEILHPVGASIPALSLIFLHVCQAIGYTHSKGILHRDIKPENIIVGKYGEVLILDWGIAEYFTKEQPVQTGKKKIPGTLTYMPPERAFGVEDSPSTDIYALGVILYQILTLRLPFPRTTLADFRKSMKYERLIDPTEMAPYRDIPLQLADIVKKCLSPNKTMRFQSVEELILELNNYIEGRPEWVMAASLDIDRKEDWRFQENILLAKHIAITRTADVLEWVGIMLSKSSFLGNIKLEATVSLSKSSEGIGFLIGVTEESVKKGLEEGYCVWIGSKSHPGCTLFRSHVEVTHNPDLFITQNARIRIEKVDNHVRFFLNDELKLSYSSHIPLTGSLVGIILKDADFHIDGLRIFNGSQNVMVNCLSVPDAFLTNKDYTKAVQEYRRIGSSFPGRAEGREAQFRAGVALLEEALCQKRSSEKKRLFLLALDEFGRLHDSPGAPLEYLGKSLVYKAEGELEEEIKCLELALRKYPKHPLLSILTEHVVFRLHESSLKNRVAAYHFALLSLRLLPNFFANADNKKLIASLTKYMERIPFLESNSLELQLSFLLAKPITLVEILESETNKNRKADALFALLELKAFRFARENLHFIKDDPLSYEELDIALFAHEKSLEKAFGRYFAFKQEKPDLGFRGLCHLLEFAIDSQKVDIIAFFEKAFSYFPSGNEKKQLDALFAWALILQNKYKQAGQVLKSYSDEALKEESSPLYFIYGCYLVAEKGSDAAKAHFSSLSDSAYPATASLLGHYLLRRIDLKKGWITQAFYWEKLQLYRELVLYYHCKKNKKQKSYFQKKIKAEVRKFQRSF